MVSPHGLKPRAVPQSLSVPPADVCLQARGPQRGPVRGSDRRLRGSEIWIPSVRSGSGPANQSAEPVARNLPMELGYRRADVRLDRVPTQTGPTGFSKAVSRSDRPGQGQATVERSFAITWSRPAAAFRKLSSQLSREGIESSGLFGGFGLLVLRRVWVKGDGVDEAPIAGLS